MPRSSGRPAMERDAAASGGKRKLALTSCEACLVWQRRRSQPVRVAAFERRWGERSERQALQRAHAMQRGARLHRPPVADARPAQPALQPLSSFGDCVLQRSADRTRAARRAAPWRSQHPARSSFEAYEHSRPWLAPAPYARSARAGRQPNDRARSRAERPAAPSSPVLFRAQAVAPQQRPRTDPQRPPHTRHCEATRPQPRESRPRV